MFNNRDLLTIKSLVLGTVLLSLTQTSALGFTLDLFTDFNELDEQFVETNRTAISGDFSEDQDTNLNTVNVFGGDRTIRTTKLSNDRGTTSLSLFDGQASSSVAANISGTTEIIWDGISDSGSFINITDDNGDLQRSFEIEIISLDVGNNSDETENQGFVDLALNFELEDKAGNIATITEILDDTQNFDNQSLLFYYANRVESTNDAGGDINLRKVDYIRFYTSDENIGDDFTFDLIQSSSVPFEFSPALGLIISVIGLGCLELKRRKANH